MGGRTKKTAAAAADTADQPATKRSKASKTTSPAKAKGKTSKSKAKEKKGEKEEVVVEEDRTEEEEKIEKMAAGEEKHESRIIEKGHMYFFYRPKIDAQLVNGPADVAKFYIMLSPEEAAGRVVAKEEHLGKEPKPAAGQARHRLLLVPSKTLPDSGETRAQLWGFVEAASADLEEVETHLERYSYMTKTKGERTTQVCRLLGEAKYELVQQASAHTYLVYELLVPETPEAPQKAFHIAKEGHFLIQVKNPNISTPASDSARFGNVSKPVHLPEHLQAKFKGKKRVAETRWTACSTSEFLDVIGVQILMVSVHKTAHQEFDDIVTELEREVDKEEQEIHREKTAEDHTYKDLHTTEKDLPDAVHKFK